MRTASRTRRSARSGSPAPPEGDPFELSRTGGVGHGPRLVEEVVRRAEREPGLVEQPAPKQDRPADAARPRLSGEAAGLLGELGRLGEDLLRLGDVEPRVVRRRDLDESEALEVGRPASRAISSVSLE